MQPPNLKYIDSTRQSIDVEAMTTKESIVAAKFIGLEPGDGRFSALLDQLPNLKHLIVCRLNMSQMKQIIQIVKTLKRLYFNEYKTYRKNNPSEFYIDQLRTIFVRYRRVVFGLESLHNIS